MKRASLRNLNTQISQLKGNGLIQLLLCQLKMETISFRPSGSTAYSQLYDFLTLTLYFYTQIPPVSQKKPEWITSGSWPIFAYFCADSSDSFFSP